VTKAFFEGHGKWLGFFVALEKWREFMAGTKGRSGRKRLPTISIHVRIILRPGRDDDLIQFFESVPCGRRAEAVKATMRGGNLADGLAIAQATEVAGQSDMIDALGEWDV
jgi:hypothetical protein